MNQHEKINVLIDVRKQPYDLHLAALMNAWDALESKTHTHRILITCAKGSKKKVHHTEKKKKKSTEHIGGC